MAKSELTRKGVTLNANIPVGIEEAKNELIRITGRKTWVVRLATNSQPYKQGFTELYPTKVKSCYFCKKHHVVYCKMVTKLPNGREYEHKTAFTTLAKNNEAAQVDTLNKKIVETILAKRNVKTTSKAYTSDEQEKFRNDAWDNLFRAQKAMQKKYSLHCLDNYELDFENEYLRFLDDNNDEILRFEVSGIGVYNGSSWVWDFDKGSFYKQNHKGLQILNDRAGREMFHEGEFVYNISETQTLEAISCALQILGGIGVFWFNKDDIQVVLLVKSVLNKTNYKIKNKRHCFHWEGVTPWNKEVVRSKSDLQSNIMLLEDCISQGENIEFAKSIISRGICFVPYSVGDDIHFAPSRFVGYLNNSKAKHENNLFKDGRITNAAINSVLDSVPETQGNMDRLFKEFCEKHGIAVREKGQFGNSRKFWSIFAMSDLSEELIDDESILFDIKEIELRNDIKDTEKKRFVSARLGQGWFRNQLINLWKNCPVSGCTVDSILRASHIKPWKDSSNQERLDVFNGILLTPNLDLLFDKGFISFENDGTMLRSSLISSNNFELLGVNANLGIIKFDERHYRYLEWHRNNVFKK